MSVLSNRNDIPNDILPSSPRLRVSRTAALTITPEWQDVVFNGVDPYNVNTFGMMKKGKRSVWYDPATNKFMFEQPEERNYDIALYYRFGGGLRPIDIVMRYMVPAPTPIYFPFPNSVGYKNLITLERILATSGEDKTIIYANDALRQYGMKVQMKYEQALVLSPPSLLETAMIVYGR